jgi:Zn-dependent peptidase ImmA (M78 family)
MGVMKVNVKGQTYIVEYKPLTDNHGLCDKEKHVITIDSETKGKLHRITLAHEIFHAYLNEMYVSDIISDDLEEILSEIVGHMITKHLDLWNKS